MSSPSVSIVIPTFNEEARLEATLASVSDQSYPNLREVLVVDGRSTDATREIAARRPGVRVLDNPRRIQAAALNIGLEAAQGEVIVRVDGHCSLAHDYVEECVAALARTGAAMVGGPMVPTGSSRTQRGIAHAMRSRLGAGPARFHRPGHSGWVDTVYLGAYRRDDARRAGGYSEDVGVNEDAEFAVRMQRLGGIWLDDRIRSTYVVRPDLQRLARQFFRYGRSRAATVRRHPSSMAARQLLPPAFLLSLLTPARSDVLRVYGLVLALGTAPLLMADAEAAPAFLVALPTMHVSWALGFLTGFISPVPPARVVGR